MDNLRNLGSKISVRINADENKFTGRECPQTNCEGYFKIEFGTGLKGEGLPCHCPYCGHTAAHNQFWTKEQLEYARSVAVRKITDALHQDLKQLEFNHQSSGPFGFGISLKVNPGSPTPIRHYREKNLETELKCSNCTLRYAIYGVFAFCPDCGQHNSLQILNANLSVIDKMLTLAETAEASLAEKLIDNALEDCVSSFDGYGRELCRVHKTKATNPTKAEKISFQNLELAKAAMLEYFQIDISSLQADSDWRLAVLGFQKRHLIAHRMGVIDQDYITKSGDKQAIVGRKISINAPEVRSLIHSMSQFAKALSEKLAS